MREGDVVQRCETCEKPTVHRDGACQVCVLTKQIGALKAKGARPFDFPRMLGAALILALFAVFIAVLVSR